MAQPILNSVTLPDPTGGSLDEILQGGVLETASGEHVIDVVAAGLLGSSRTVYKLEWNLVTQGELDDINDAYWGMVDSGWAEYVHIDSSILNVQPTKNVGVKVGIQKTAGGIRYNVSCEFQEFS